MASLFSRKPTVEFGTDSVTVSGMMYREKVYYREFTSVEVRENIKPAGSGYNGLRYTSGIAHSRDIGRYSVVADKRIKQFVVIRHLRGTLIFNTGSEDETLMAYMTVKSKVKKRKQAPQPHKVTVVKPKPKISDIYGFR
jgi:hypothetical protein